MKINHKIQFVDGPFDTDKGKLICVISEKYADVHLCFKENMNIPFAKIKLFSKDLYIDAKATMNDAYKLGNEIAKRWNEHIKQLPSNWKTIEKGSVKLTHHSTSSIVSITLDDKANALKESIQFDYKQMEELSEVMNIWNSKAQ